MTDTQFNTLLQVLAQQSNRIEELTQEVASNHRELKAECATIRKEMKQGFKNQAKYDHETLTMIGRSTRSHEKRITKLEKAILQS